MCTYLLSVEEVYIKYGFGLVFWVSMYITRHSKTKHVGLEIQCLILILL